MKTLLLLGLLLIAISNVLLAQSSGFLIVKNDTNEVFIGQKDADLKPRLFYGSSRQTATKEISAYDAEAAYVPGKWKYLSIYLPDSEVRAWAKCYFDGKYKLVEYNETYFIVHEKTSTALIPICDKNGQPRFQEQLANLFAKEINYNYSTLTYDANVLVKPLKQMHQQNGETFEVYKSYHKNKTHSYLELTGSKVKGLINLADLDKIEAVANAANIGIGRNFYFPKCSKNLSFALGAKLGLYHFDEKTTFSDLGSQKNVRFVKNVFVPAINAALQYDVADGAGMSVSLKVGVEASKMMSNPTEIHVSTIDDSKVQVAEHHELGINNELQFSHFYQVLVGFPKISESICLGVGKSFNFNKMDEDVMNELNIDGALNFSLYLKF